MKSSIDRNNLADIPSYTKMFEKIKAVDPSKGKGNVKKRLNWIKAASAILVLTGCRVTELLLLRKKDIRFFGFNKAELMGNFDISEIASMQFNLYTEKNRKNKYRVVPVVKNSFFIDVLSIVFDYWRQFDYDDSFIVPYTRQSVWYGLKTVFGNDMFPHFLRHVAVTNDTKAGISPSIIKSKYGWTDLRPHSIYSHLNWFDIQSAQTSAWGGPAPAAQAIILKKRPSWMKAQTAQMRALGKKVEHSLYNNEKYVPTNYTSIEEALRKHVATGDTINGKVVTIFSNKRDFEVAKKRYDGNKFFLIYAKDDDEIQRMKVLAADRNARAQKKCATLPPVAPKTPNLAVV